jgi:hypothetical protein
MCYHARSFSSPGAGGQTFIPWDVPRPPLVGGLVVFALFYINVADRDTVAQSCVL